MPGSGWCTRRWSYGYAARSSCAPGREVLRVHAAALVAAGHVARGVAGRRRGAAADWAGDGGRRDNTTVEGGGGACEQVPNEGEVSIEAGMLGG